MSAFTLNAAAFVRLKAQLNLNGSFNHTLRNAQRTAVPAIVAVEQCCSAIHVKVSIGTSHNCLTIKRGQQPPTLRIAKFIEACANGTSFDEAPFPEEAELASQTEITLRSATRLGRGTYWLNIADIDDFSVCLRPSNGGGSLATLEAGNATMQVQLPRDVARAYSQLAENVHRFATGLRAAALA